jgi:hypothetical protein
VCKIKIIAIVYQSAFLKEEIQSITFNIYNNIEKFKYLDTYRVSGFNEKERIKRIIQSHPIAIRFESRGVSSDTGGWYNLTM